jgi:hypothetical protein
VCVCFAGRYDCMHVLLLWTRLLVRLIVECVCVCVCVLQAATTACTCYCSGLSPQTLSWQEVGTFSVSDPYSCRYTACQTSYPSSCNSAAQGCSTTSPCGVSALLNDLSLQCGLSGTVPLPIPRGGGQSGYTQTQWLQGTIAVLECPVGTDGRSSSLVSFPDLFVQSCDVDLRCVLHVGTRYLIWCYVSWRTVEPSTFVDLCRVHSYVLESFPSCWLSLNAVFSCPCSLRHVLD